MIGNEGEATVRQNSFKCGVRWKEKSIYDSGIWRFLILPLKRKCVCFRREILSWSQLEDGEKKSCQKK